MDNLDEELFNKLSQLRQRRSKTASSIVNPQYDNVIPIAVSYSSGLSELVNNTSGISKAASSGDRWTKKTRLRTTEAEDLRSLLFGQA